MTSKKNYFINIFQNHDFINKFGGKRSIYTIAVLSILLVSTSFSFGAVNAQLDFDDFMKQTQENIQSTIENSENSNNNNNNNCDNNISIQSQTNENGKTTSTTRSTCDGETSTTSSTNNDGLGGTSDGNLNGTIVSSEFDQQSGDIVSSIYGIWSLTTRDDGSKSFNANFTKQPIYYNSSETMIAQNETATGNSTISNNLSTNTTSYKLSNFVGNSVQQQNEDVTYSGKIDVSEEIHSNNATISDETNNYRGIGVSISLIDNRVLFINFDTKSVVSEEFTNVPIVGLVKR
ncbi:MAG TPA: hypothetical protein VD815_00345 [Candidatus Saccharimonadales bacterium]|nr:hypothetical protein [Candidatus Saccharimonadales bacterium]